MVSETWLVAVTSAGEAADLQLKSGVPVMATGGFSGGDDALTVDQLKAYVAQGQLRYIVLGGQGRGGPDGGGSSQMSQWVQDHGTVVTVVGNGTLYDLAGAGNASSAGLSRRPASSGPDPGCARC